jgi:4-azaleucine resistance transporter AzlC
MSETRTAFSSGISAMAPLLLGIVPFGLIFGVAAVESGVGAGAGIGLSVFVFAGAAQLATVELVGSDTAPAVIVATALIINARHLMYSASLAPQFTGLGRLGRIGVAYLLTDQGYAVSITEYRKHPMSTRQRVAFYLGAAVALWVTWQACTIIGIVLGAGVPEEWSLDFAVPLVFLALLVPAITDRSSAAAAAAAGIIAALAAGLPLNLGIMAGATAGIVAGVVTERSLPPKTP